jgi:hypothetical protein
LARRMRCHKRSLSRRLPGRRPMWRWLVRTNSLGRR